MIHPIYAASVSYFPSTGLFFFLVVGGCGSPSVIPLQTPQIVSEETTVSTVSAGAIRFATYNVSLYRRAAGQLERDLATGSDLHAVMIAEVIQRVRPDVLLLNEFDYNARGAALKMFQQRFLAVGQHRQQPIEFVHSFTAPVNTGEPTGFDMDNDGSTDGPADAIGYGKYPGQYGMAILSKYPIDMDAVRTFQKFLWRDMPDAKLPRAADGSLFYTDDELAVLRLSSKSFWDVPIRVPNHYGEATIHFLVAHPTPPVFDGPEDRNGLRNYDEIRMIADYISPKRGDYLVDDANKRGRLAADDCFVIAGDMNADPLDGQSADTAIQQLLEHPRVTIARPPASEGGLQASTPTNPKNRSHRGNPTHDTADFNKDGAENLRVDYVLPSRSLPVVASGVFWPRKGEPGGKAIHASDHRLVWADVSVVSPENACK